MLNARTGEAMQFRGSDESSTSLDSANAAHQMPDENSAVADEDASHDMEAVDNDMEPPENDTDVDAASTVGEMDSNNEGASFVQQASKGEAMDSNASKGEMDSLDAEADPVDAVDDDAAAGDDSSVVGEEDGAVIERASENKDETIGGEPVDREIQPHYD